MDNIIISPHQPCPISLRGACVIIGNFDGVHVGHKALITAGLATGLRVIALTFNPHPREYFTGQPQFMLNSLQEKAKLLFEAGVVGVALCPFDKALAALSPQEFIDKVLLNWLSAKAVITGKGFRFGSKRAGGEDELSMQHFTYHAMPPVHLEGGVVSSSRIRAALMAGDIALANRLLGRVYSLCGVVQHGAKQGRELGYPTANIALSQGFALKHGIYAVTCSVEGVPHKGVCSFGTRPMFDNGLPLLETYLFDFSGDLYGKEIEIFLHSFIREELKFASLDDLIVAMGHDCAKAQKDLENV